MKYTISFIPHEDIAARNTCLHNQDHFFIPVSFDIQKIDSF